MPQKRAGALGVHSIDHFALQLPDLGQARHFFESFGLDVKDDGERLAISAGVNPHIWGRLSEGPVKQLRYLSFGIFADDEAAFSRHIDSKGIKRINVPQGGINTGLWIEGFDRLPINIQIADKVSPDTKTEFVTVSSGAGESGAIFNSKAPKIKPRHMSHLAIYCSDVMGATAWYTDTLGLRLSDGSGLVVAFLHGPHGSDHHLLALVGSSHCGLHHTSWDVESVQDVGLGSAQMMRAGYPNGWGVGRHVLGGNYFYYASDPWGSHAEYSADIDFIPADCEWPANADHAPEDSFYLWGPGVPEGFVTNTEPQKG